MVRSSQAENQEQGILEEMPTEAVLSHPRGAEVKRREVSLHPNETSMRILRKIPKDKRRAVGYLRVSP